jgi:hypothetical protein
VLVVPDATIQKIAEGHRLPHQSEPAVAIELAGAADRLCRDVHQPASLGPENPDDVVVKFRRLDS